MVVYNYEKKGDSAMQTKRQYEKKADERFKIEKIAFDDNNFEHFHRALELAYVLKNN